MEELSGCDRDCPYNWRSLKYLLTSFLRTGLQPLFKHIWKRLKKHLQTSLLGQYSYRNQDPVMLCSADSFPGTQSLLGLVDKMPSAHFYAVSNTPIVTFTP